MPPTTLLVSAAMPRSVNGPTAVAKPWLEWPARRAGLDKHGLAVLPFPWKDFAAYEERLKRMSGVYDRFTRELSKALNSLHKLDLPARFWELQAGAWLQTFLHTLDGVYHTLERARALYGSDLVVAGVRKIACAHDGFDAFINAWCVDEAGIAGLHALVAERMGIPVAYFEWDHPTNFPRLLTAPPDRNAPPPQRPASVEEGGQQVLAHNLHCHARVREVARELGLSLFDEGVHEHSHDGPSRQDLVRPECPGAFEKLAWDLLPGFLPAAVVEQFSSIMAKAEEFSRHKAFLSGNWLSEGHVFLAAAGLGMANGAHLIGWQHGGAYGHHRHCQTEWVERRLCDHFITWGWTDGLRGRARLAPLPQMQLDELKDAWKPGGKTALLAGNTVPRQTYRYQLHPAESHFFPRYLETRGAFLRTLSPEVAAALVYRPYLWDYGWHDLEREQIEAATGPQWSCEGSLTDLLRSTGLFVCDHIGTGMLQALVMNTPTVLFWDREFSPEREGSEPYFDMLRQAGILFHDGGAAAVAVNAAMKDPAAWWRDPRRREARDSFVERYCLTSRYWAEQWRHFLRHVLREDNYVP